MVFTSLLAENKGENLKLLHQISVSENPSVSRVLTHVAQTVSEILKHSYSIQASSSNDIQTTSIRATEPEHRKIMFVEPLSLRELQVLQLIVDGDRNSIIAQKLYISEQTVKTHVRNILKKLCVSDRTQAAVCALRSGLVH